MAAKDCTILARISEIENLQEQEVELKERIRILLNPILHDVDLISVIYSLFTEIYQHDTFKKCEEMERRKQFIIIILYLYSPQKLVDLKIKKGLRDKIADALGLSVPTIISNDCKDLLFEYKTYVSFQNSTDWIFEQILEGLKKGKYMPADGNL